MKKKICNQKECIHYNEEENDHCKYGVFERSICTYDENCPAFELDN